MREQNQTQDNGPCNAGRPNCDGGDGRPAIRIAVIGNMEDVHRTVTALADGRLERAAEMVKAGLDPHEAAERNDIPYDVLVAAGAVDQGPMDFVVPVKYEVEGYIVVKAMTPADAILAAGKNGLNGIVLEEPEIIDGSTCICGDCELVDVYSGLYRKNAFKHPAVQTGITSDAARSYMREKKPGDETCDEPGDAGGGTDDRDPDESEEDAK